MEKAKHKRQIPWLGLVSLVCGGALLYLFFTRPVPTQGRGAVSLFIYLGMGSLLTIWGGWLFFSELMPNLGRNRPRRVRVTMPVEAMVYVVLLVAMFLGALLGRSNLVMLVFSLLAGPFIINGSITLTMLRRIYARRRVPDHAVAGEWFSVDLLLDNRKRWLSSWMLIVQDSLRHATTQLQATVIFTRLPPHSTQTGTYTVCLQQRGRYRIGPLVVASRYPLGLMERAVILEEESELIVYPRIGQLTDLARQSLARSQDAAPQSRARRGSFDDEFYRLREYQSGDSPRAVHWRTSARLNRLMIRQYHQDRDDSLLLLLDAWQPAHPSPLQAERVEAAVSAAASFCVDFCRRGGRSRLVLGTSGKTVELWEGPGTEAALPEVMRRLALLAAGPSPEIAELCTRGMAMSDRTARKILITSRSAADRGIPAHSLEGALAALGPGELEVISADESLKKSVILPEPAAV